MSKRVVPTRQAWNRFLGSVKGLQIRAQAFGQIFKDKLERSIPHRAYDVADHTKRMHCTHLPDVKSKDQGHYKLVHVISAD
jgi:hypothetical protein